MKKFLVITSLIVLVGMGCAKGAEPASEASQSGEHNRLQSLSFEDYDGNTVSLADFEGTHLVINSWAAWCPFCKDELPDLADIQEEFEDDIVMIAINRQETRRTAKKYSDELGVTDRMTLLLDPRDSFYRTIGGFSMPETIFVEPDGTIQFHKRGIMPIEEIRQRVNALMQ